MFDARELNKDVEKVEQVTKEALKEFQHLLTLDDE